MEDMHPIDQLFRDELEKNQPAFEEAHWDALESELDKNKKDRGFVYWRYAAMLALFLIGSWTAYQYLSLNKTSEIAQSTSAKDQTPTNVAGANENVIIAQDVTVNSNQVEEPKVKATSGFSVTEKVEERKPEAVESKSTAANDKIAGRDNVALEKVEAVQEKASVVDPQLKESINTISKFETKPSVKNEAKSLEIAETKTDLASVDSENSEPVSQLSTVGEILEKSEEVNLPALEREVASNQKPSTVLEVKKEPVEELVNAVEAAETNAEILGNEYGEDLAGLDAFVEQKEVSGDSPTDIESAAEASADLAFLVCKEATLSTVGEVTLPKAQAILQDIEEPKFEKIVEEKEQRNGFFALGPALEVGWNSTTSLFKSQSSSDLANLPYNENTRSSYQMPGLELAYHFSDHLEISLGAFLGNETYMGGLSSLQFGGNETESTTALKISLEEEYENIVSIPLSLAYTFRPAEKMFRPYVSAGINYSRFSGQVLSSVPYELVTENPAYILPGEMDADDPDDVTTGNQGGAPGLGPTTDSVTGDDSSPPAPEESEIVEPAPQFIASRYAASSFVNDQQLSFNNKVDKTLPLQYLFGLGGEFSLSEKWKLRLSAKYRFSRAITERTNYAIEDVDPLAQQYNVENSKAVFSERGFHNFGILAGLRFNFN